MSLRPGRRAIERRRATVLFADLLGFTAISETLDAEQAYAHVTACVRLLDAVLRRHGGAVDKYLGDALLAVFGYPVPSEDAAAAAIRAALEMRREVASYNRDAGLEVPLALSVGINTGILIAGDIRGAVIREFHVLGDTVNTAARLKSRAPAGRIYVGPETWDEAGHLFEGRALPPVRLKGKRRPVPVHEVAGSRHGYAEGRRAEERIPLVGRERELACLRERVAQLREGRGGVVALVGEEGAGKSRLLSELLEGPECESVAVLRCTAAPAGGARRFELAAGRVGGEPGNASLSELVEEVRKRAAETPVLVVLDEVPRAEPAFREPLEALGETAAQCPVLVIVALRPDAEADPLTWSGGLRAGAGQAFGALEVGALAPGEARSLVARLVADRESSAEAVDLVVERGAGNPRRLVLASYLTDALRSERERAREAQERSSETERRRSTVLFADLTGFTAMSERMDPGEAYAIVTDCLGLLDEIARKHGGTVDKYLGDCVLALFGVPAAMEDAPRAALNAAIEMIEAVRRYGRERGFGGSFDLHVGISTGLGIAGEISGPLIREYAVMGDAVVVASELSDHAAAGEILVGPETHRFTRDEFEFRPGRALSVKGRVQPVASFELVSREQRLHRARPGAERRVFSRLVGREREVQALEGILEGLRGGRGAIVSLVAEAGVGKTRLVADLAARHAGAGVAWLEGRALSTGLQHSYGPFADLLRLWAGIGDGEDEETARTRLREALGPIAGEETDDLLPWLARVVGVAHSEAERRRLDSVPGDVRDRLVRTSLTRWLRLMSERTPTVVVLDDLHWADQSSIVLLESLLRLVEERPIALLCVFRPGYAETSDRILQRLRDDHPDHHLELAVGPLDGGAARELIKSLFRRGDVPHATRTLIEEKAKGNPFYIEEVVRSLLDAGAVEFVDGSFRATKRIHTVEIPGTVQEVIMARVDRLPPAEKALLRVASVVGQNIHRDVLEELAPDPERVETDLRSLLDAEFLVRESAPGRERFGFKHPLIQEMAYDGILMARREELHGRVAVALEARLPRDTPGLDAMLAYHFSMGRDAQRAETYLFRAGDEAARVGAASEALHFFREASRLYFAMHGEGGDPHKKALLEKNVGLALYNRGQLVEADEHFNGALRHLGEKVPRGSREVTARFARNMASVLTGLYLPRSGGIRPATDLDREVIDLMMKRAEAQTTASPRRFLFDSMDAVARLDRVDATTVPGAGGMYAGTVGIFSYGGLSFRVGRRFLSRADPLVRPEDADEYLFYRVMRFLHHLLEGDWAEQHAVPDELLWEGLRLGRIWPVTSYLNLDGLKQIYRGEWERARARIDRLRQIAARYEHDLAASAASALTGILHLERRELPEALEVLERYRDDHPEAAFQVSALGNRMVVELLRGDVDAAEETRRRAERLVAEAGRMLPYHLSSFRRAGFALDVARLAEASAGERVRRRLRARASRRAALASADRVAWRRPEVLRTAGRHAWVLGRKREARRWWRRALAEGERLGARAEIARTHLEVGRRARRAGVPGLDDRSPEEHLSEARARLEALGLSEGAEGPDAPAPGP